MFAKHPVSSHSTENARVVVGQERRLRTVRNLFLAWQTPPPHFPKHLPNMGLAPPPPQQLRINGQGRDWGCQSCLRFLGQVTAVGFGCEHIWL